MNRLLSLGLILLFPVLARGDVDPGQVLEQPIPAAIETLNQQLNANPNDENARFALGIAQALHGVENLSASLYRHGFRKKGLGEEVPLFRIPLPQNPDPVETSIDDMDAMIAQFVADLQTAQKTLAMVHDPNVKLPVRVGMIRLDLNGDAPGGETALWEIGAMNDLRISKEDAADFKICFDLGDARWLEGYTHLLGAIGEMYLGYDKRDLFDVSGHLFFEKPKATSAFLKDAGKIWDIGGVDAADLVAFIHMIRLPVKDPARLAAAREDLLAMIRCSRESWHAILKETDDDHEWLPNPHQTNMIANIHVTQEVVDRWLGFLTDCQDALEGRKLIPFWRAKGSQGINLKRVFTEPRMFDLVLWIQGTAAKPYLEEGELCTGANIQQLDRLLAGRLFLFSLWVN